MAKKICLLSFILIGLLLKTDTKTVYADEILIAGASAFPKNRQVVKKSDLRISKLKYYLEKHHSPLAEYAPIFIRIADKYGLSQLDLDFLLPAITGVESSFGHFYIRGTYNAYGWASGRYYFSSWEQSIEHITRSLKRNYIAKGADTIPKIGRIYAESLTWPQKVNYFVHEIKSSPADPILSL
ncbi:MAG TPA: hypothetical protein VMW41_03945 [Candidatus Bathyarchaeia archaeon]|nr:hypothetical protein [Candidatus Bathyarchaeia archaeon]